MITSRLGGAAANVVGERSIGTWDDLKTTLREHFGDPRTEKCLLLELQALKLYRNESYLNFCHRIQHCRNMLIAKVTETTNDVALRRAKDEIYNNTSFEVFLYNLSPHFANMVRLKNVSSLEGALKVVLEEESFHSVYNVKTPLKNPNYNKQNPNDNFFESNARMDRFPNNSYNPLRQNFNHRPPNNFNGLNGSQLFRNSNNFRNQPHNNNSFNSNNQWQLTPTFRMPNQHMPMRNMTPRANTDVTMRTASARRVNYTENNDVNSTYLEPYAEPTPGPSQDNNQVQNFFLEARTTGIK